MPLPGREAEYRADFRRYVTCAKTRGINFDLDERQFRQFYKSRCFYCREVIIGIGLDRIDSDRGYSLDNIVPCCTICNRMKMALETDIFLDQCRKIVRGAGEWRL